MEPDLAFANIAECPHRQGIHHPGRRGNGGGAELPRAAPVHGSHLWMVQSNGRRDLRNALPKRFAVFVRFVEVRASLWIHWNTLRRRNSAHCIKLPKRRLMCAFLRKPVRRRKDADPNKVQVLSAVARNPESAPCVS